VGLAPQWLYQLMPTELAFQPFAAADVAPQLELLGAAGVAYLVLRLVRAAPREQDIGILDIDALYRGPAAGAGRWAGILLLRLYGAWRALADRIAHRAAKGLAGLARACDRPYGSRGEGAAQLAAIAALLLIMLLTT
jgi:hypothetical protein